tara:strand:+ start:870 stop:1103 length:234 start_codon:yes stop_codon:yes gene_type:complete
MLPPAAKIRTAKQCEIYLARLAAAMRKGSEADARRLLPLVARLKAELEAARAEDELLLELLNPDLFGTTHESEFENE